MPGIYFSSVLSVEYRKALEGLMFFNEQQGLVKQAIMASIDQYGLPRIFPEGELLRIRVEKLAEVQALFAMADAGGQAHLVGVIIYVRREDDTILVLHVAVNKEYSSSGSHADQMLAIRLISTLREIAGRIKGVRSLMVVYGEGIIRKMQV